MIPAEIEGKEYVSFDCTFYAKEKFDTNMNLNAIIIPVSWIKDFKVVLKSDLPLYMNWEQKVSAFKTLFE